MEMRKDFIRDRLSVPSALQFFLMASRIWPFIAMLVDPTERIHVSHVSTSSRDKEGTTIGYECESIGVVTCTGRRSARLLESRWTDHRIDRLVFKHEKDSVGASLAL